MCQGTVLCHASERLLTGLSEASRKKAFRSVTENRPLTHPERGSKNAEKRFIELHFFGIFYMIIVVLKKEVVPGESIRYLNGAQE